MGYRKRHLIGALALCLLLAACSRPVDSHDASVPDRGSPDVGVPDTRADLLGAVHPHDAGQADAVLQPGCAALGFCRHDSDCGPGQTCAGCARSWCVQCAGIFERCVPVAPCLENSDCAPYGFCILGTLWDRKCPSVESPGRCAPVLPTWEQCVTSEPVCGCDGLSYDSMCRISFASTDLRAKGLCKEPRYSCDELIAGFDADIALAQTCVEDKDCTSVALCDCSYPFGWRRRLPRARHFAYTFEKAQRCVCPDRSCPRLPTKRCVNGLCQ